jgi:hypothetical protein
MSRDATPLEAYLTGVVFTALKHYGLPDHLHPASTTNDEGVVTGEIELHTMDGRVRASILVTEVEA